jgi:peptidoglycan hydrolase CwlO-like protein
MNHCRPGHTIPNRDNIEDAYSILPKTSDVKVYPLKRLTFYNARGISIQLYIHFLNFKVMIYSISNLQSVASCDELITMITKEKGDLEFRKNSLERQRAALDENFVENSEELVAITTELETIDSIIAALPEGEMKTELTSRRKKLDSRLFDLQVKSENYNEKAKVDKEFDIGKVERQVEEADLVLAELNAKKVALSS